MKRATDQGDYSNSMSLLEFNPSMDARNVLENIRTFNISENNPSLEPVLEGREKLLRENGYNPEDWVYYTDVKPYGKTTDFTDADMESLGKPFPPDIELLVLPGRFVGGLKVSPSSLSLFQYEYIERDRGGKMNYTVFVRVRPKSLSSPS